MRYLAHEYTVTDESIDPTGRVELYLADTAEQAAEHCLYTRRLSNGHANLGPTGLVVYSGKYRYAIIPDKRPT